MRHEISGEETILVNPSRGRSGNVTAVNIEAISPNGHFLAYSVRDGGTDYASTEIVDTREATILPDRIQAGFCSGLIFSPDDSGFYYSHQSVNTARPNYRALRWHRLGTDLADDPEIFVAGEQPGLNLATVASWDAGVLVHAVLCTGKHRKTALYIQPIAGREEAALLASDIEGYCIPFFVRAELLALTDLAAPNFRIVRIDTNNPATCNWKDIVPESDSAFRRSRRSYLCHTCPPLFHAY
jgi:prolyl oligopeptidase